MTSKLEYLSPERSLDSTPTEYDTGSEYCTASEYDDGENGSLTSGDKSLTTKDKKNFLHTCTLFACASYLGFLTTSCWQTKDWMRSCDGLLR